VGERPRFRGVLKSHLNNVKNCVLGARLEPADYGGWNFEGFSDEWAVLLTNLLRSIFAGATALEHLSVCFTVSNVGDFDAVNRGEMLLYELPRISRTDIALDWELRVDLLCIFWKKLVYVIRGGVWGTGDEMRA